LDHYHVTLDGFPADGGDVICDQGEVIGTYTVGDNDYCEFTPNGADVPIISGYHVGPFCREIAEWNRKQESI
jgi:hypothetical protein